MPTICEYTDYRKFLWDFYEEVKGKTPQFSYQLFSEKAGIASKGYLFNVIRGKRDLAREYVLGLARAMKLDANETEYFDNLVAFNQATGLKDRNYYYEKLAAIKTNGKTAWKPQILRKDQFEYYSTWYHSVIRSLIALYGYKGDFLWLAKNTYPRIKPAQAKKSVELLKRLGMIKRQGNGNYIVTDKSVTTAKEVYSLAAMNFHDDVGKLALNALHGISRERRNFSGMTLGISKKVYDEICENIYALRQKILQKAEQDPDADAVYQLNFQFFPVSSVEIERKRT